jgi:hypothetical protein
MRELAGGKPAGPATAPPLCTEPHTMRSVPTGAQESRSDVRAPQGANPSTSQVPSSHGRQSGRVEYLYKPPIMPRPLPVHLILASLLCYGSFARMLPVHLRPASGASERILGMKGNLLPMGIFYTTVSVGTPPREFPVTVDTGSTDMLLPVAGEHAFLNVPHSVGSPGRPSVRCALCREPGLLASHERPVRDG